MGHSERLALVLAGGGIAGIAWETGFLLGVQDEAPSVARRLLEAELLLGTSAGSAVAAQISSGTPLQELYALQLAPPSHEIAPSVDINELIELFEHTKDADVSIRQRLRWIGEHAASAPTVSEEARRAVIAQRLPSHQWPERRLEITAIDVETGERVLFDRDSGVSLVDAVAASCAVPVVWPPVTIGRRRFIDGGVGSSANVDAVSNSDVVVMLSPMPEPGFSPFGRSLADELAEHPGRALGVFADEESVAAFGRNPLDPACRAPSAVAGREQGWRDAAKVAAFLEDGR
ncbi:MAG: patatin-like phospholipase family protein [Mycobacterium sp.]